MPTLRGAWALAAWLGSLACGVCAAAPGDDAPQPLRHEVVEPRAFGYRVGDTALRKLVIEVPGRLRLDEASVPEIGRIGGALELRAVARAAERTEHGARLTLELEYQVFASPPAVRVFELPPVRLRFDGQPRAEELRVDAWPMVVSPLAPDPVATRTGLGELRADTPPPALDAALERGVLAACAAMALGLCGYLAWVYGALPWWSRRHRPFGRAYRLVRTHAVPAGETGASLAAWREASRALHAAFNETAGRVVFADTVDAFLAKAPRYAALRGDILSFFARTEAAFFGTASVSPPPGQDEAERRWLLGFARACRDAERGTA